MISLLSRLEKIGLVPVDEDLVDRESFQVERERTQGLPCFSGKRRFRRDVSRALVAEADRVVLDVVAAAADLGEQRVLLRAGCRLRWCRRLGNRCAHRGSKKS